MSTLYSKPIGQLWHVYFRYNTYWPIHAHAFGILRVFPSGQALNTCMVVPIYSRKYFHVSFLDSQPIDTLKTISFC